MQRPTGRKEPVTALQKSNLSKVSGLRQGLRQQGLRIHPLCKGKLLKALCDLCFQNQKSNLHNAPIPGEEKTLFPSFSYSCC